MGIKKTYGVLIVQATRSNPNGDPDRDGAPRVDAFGYGLISPVSTKQRVRAMLARQGPAFKEAAAAAHIPEETLKGHYQIYVAKGQKPEKVLAEAKDMDAFHSKYWDARVFGNTLLESTGGRGDHRASLRCGVISVFTGRSLDPVTLGAQTWTRVAGLQEGKGGGMAPEGHKYVEYGLYLQPFAVNPERAQETNVSDQDCDLFLRLAPHVFDGRSTASAGCEVLQSWTITFHRPTCTLPIQTFLDAVRPKAKVLNPTRFEDYELVTEVDPRLPAYGEVKQWVDALPVA
jgi:CRISPR-associated protein Csd2